MGRRRCGLRRWRVSIALRQDSRRTADRASAQPFATADVPGRSLERPSSPGAVAADGCGVRRNSHHVQLTRGSLVRSTVSLYATRLRHRSASSYSNA